MDRSHSKSAAVWLILTVVMSLGLYQLRHRTVVAGSSDLHGIVSATIRPAGRTQESADTVTLRLEVARSPAARERGLMSRMALPEDGGMLFLFPQTDYHGFWMKGMAISIDLLFLSNRREIVAVFQDLPPCPSGPCRVYRAPEPVRYAIEVNPGFTERHHIRVGDRVEWDDQDAF